MEILHSLLHGKVQMFGVEEVFHLVTGGLGFSMTDLTDYMNI